MAIFIQHPSEQGNWQDSLGNKFLLLEVKDGTKVYTSHPEVSGTDEASTAASLNLTAIVNPLSPKRFPIDSIKKPVPRSVTPRQIRLALIAKGVSLDSITAAIASISDPAIRVNAQIEWEYTSTFERTYPLIEQIGTALNITSDDIDQLFRDAIKL